MHPAGYVIHSAIHRTRHDVGDQSAHADAADFFVVGQCKVNRLGQSAPQEFGHEREAHGRKTFHVGDTPAIEPIVLQRNNERIRIPRLAVDRHHVGVAGEHDATVRDVAVPRGQCGEQIRLAPFVIEYERRFDAKPGKIAAYPLDEGEVGVTARRIEPDQGSYEVERNEVFGARGSGPHLRLRSGSVHDGSSMTQRGRIAPAGTATNVNDGRQLS